jgi:hypothetical protein
MSSAAGSQVRSGLAAGGNEIRTVGPALIAYRQAARQRKKERFTSLLHHVDPAMLRTAFYAMKRGAAPGVDGMTWETYEQDLDRRIETLHAGVQAGTYRALPSRRSYIPKEDGSKRPLAVAALEDKIVQRAVAAVLSAITASFGHRGLGLTAKHHERGSRSRRPEPGRTHRRSCRSLPNMSPGRSLSVFRRAYAPKRSQPDKAGFSGIIALWPK